MGTFKGDELIEEYHQTISDLRDMLHEVRKELWWYLDNKATACNLEALMSAKDEMLPILANRFGITREDIWKK